jgi:glutamate formiminotransferase/glutamate formiminotransferase/formiminotetrahydrofolate cyclodeaminase
LLAVPNVSEGRDPGVIGEIADAFVNAGGGVRLLDVHSDGDHHRSVFTLAGAPGALADSLLAGARVAIERVDVMHLREPAGVHPCVGALDVAPIVYLDADRRGAACAEALALGDRIGAELGVPVFLYGELTGDPPRTRAELRRGGSASLAARMSTSDARARLIADFGPTRPHPSAGAALVAARPPLVAFNLMLAEHVSIEEARRIAGLIREGGDEGLPGVRAIAVALRGGPVQVSMNVERPLELPLARVVDAVRAHAPIARAELVGLAPAAAFDGFPGDVELPGFDPACDLIENALGD